MYRFCLFYFVFKGNFPSTSPREAYMWRGDLTEGFLRYRFGELIFGGAYTWRAGVDLGGGCRGCAPPSPRDDLQFSNTNGILQKNKNYVVYWC